jgi:hypothetical protein
MLALTLGTRGRGWWSQDEEDSEEIECGLGVKRWDSARQRFQARKEPDVVEGRCVRGREPKEKKPQRTFSIKPAASILSIIFCFDLACRTRLA